MFGVLQQKIHVPVEHDSAVFWDTIFSGIKLRKENELSDYMLYNRK